MLHGISFFLAVLLSFAASSDRLEVVLLEVVGDLVAEHGSLHVGGAKVDAGPHSRVDNFAQDIGQAVEASCLIERQLLGRASVKRERRTNVQRSMPHRPLYSRDHGLSFRAKSPAPP